MIGVLDIQNDQLNSFTVDDQTSLQTLADQIATAIHNAQLYSTVQQELAERQRAEAALQKANEELVQLNAEKDKFFSVVAHDLKGPFMPLLGTSELLAEMADTLEPADIKEMGQSIHRAARSLFSLLENLLLWAKAKMGQIDYQLDKTNLTYIVQQNMELLSSIATGKNITLRNRLPQSIFVHADEYMLDVVIRNLISNGLKFTANGGEVTISANVSEVASHTILNISISDTGIGIDPEDLDTLFKVSKHKSSLGTNK
jgi:signal transduction histidine kinase